jgi:hypothetical protein
MTLSERIALQVELLPAGIKQILDQQLAAGNVLQDVEIGAGAEAGKVAIMLDHPFRYVPDALPAGIEYHELKNRNPMIFEFCTTDKKWSLFTAKFKPMVLQPVQGPPDPTAAYIERMKQVCEREEAEAKRRAEGVRENNGEYVEPRPGDPAQRFIASMKMTFEMWHDGNGYDLESLDQIPADQIKDVQATLLNHRPVDWRDIEALARIDSPEAKAAVVAALNHSDPKVRREALLHVPDKLDPKDREKNLLKALQSDDVFGDLSAAIDEAEEFHPPAVVDALLKGALERHGPTAILFAGLLYFIHGKSKSAFDWDYRPFFLRFDTSDRAERITVFRELCETIGVDPANCHCEI